jgi:hypothetical protein
MLTICLLSFILLIYRQYSICPYVISPLNIYVLFTFIYTFFSYVYVVYGSEIVSIELPNLEPVIASTLLLYVVLINFVLFFLSFCPSIKTLLTFYNGSFSKGNELSFYAFITLAPITLYAVYVAPWPEFGEGFTVYHSVAAFSKLTLLYIFCCELNRNRKVLYTLLIYLVMLLVFLLDGSRTFFFVFAFSAIYAQKVRTVAIFRYLIPIASLFVVFIYITLARSGIDLSFGLMLWPFYSEGVFGSYGVYNAIATYDRYDYSFTMFPGYFIDLFSSFALDSRPLMSNFIELYSHSFRDGKLYPFGGHFFLSDFIIYFYWVAIFMFPLYFFSLLWIYKKCVRLPSLYLFLVSNFFFVVKTPIFVFVNTLIFVLVVAVVYGVLINYTPKRCSDDIC